ncbi:hypothetical protein AGDE_12808 [Angomonas deanei]|uniref:Endonuclease/Exonuclease/phosphatase family n=1 Tax=Angomonas deanei TaxID=59799 RepID=A0A7G2CIT7_9TRYP|nr:hypothetical protein AGDE_12808 [Angomonas deanei]CAD2218967.1 hypothetical protein, conserved [Angomonas deanei]|eukprot:EPY23443.1 hypothetical protein AGDE_12808 [Angomonas deanei]
MADAPPAPKKKLKRETPPPTVVDSPSGGMVSPPFGDPLSPNEAPLLLSLGKPEAKQGRSPPQLQMGSSSSGNFLAPPGAGARRPTLLERRNKADRGMSISAISGLCMDAIVDSSRDGTSIGEEQPKIEFRGWSDNIELPEESSSEHTLSRAEEMDELANSSDDVYSSKTCVKIVSYNILAARLVTTDRYPDSHPVILGEDYRIKLIKDEIKSAEPDILILSEISTEVHERLLGEFLRTQMNFYGEHVVITDKSGEPRCLPLGVPRQLDSIQRRLSPCPWGERGGVPHHTGPRGPSLQ